MLDAEIGMQDFTKEVCRRLKAAGWTFLRHGRGDHDIWHDPNTGRSLPVDGKMKPRRTANEILKRAGLPKAF